MFFVFIFFRGCNHTILSPIRSPCSNKKHGRDDERGYQCDIVRRGVFAGCERHEDNSCVGNRGRLRRQGNHIAERKQEAAGAATCADAASHVSLCGSQESNLAGDLLLVFFTCQIWWPIFYSFSPHRISYVPQALIFQFVKTKTRFAAISPYTGVHMRELNEGVIAAFAPYPSLCRSDCAPCRACRCIYGRRK